MTKPLALVFYERLLPGSRLVNRLQDLGYRVQTITEAGTLAGQARSETPLVIVMDMQSARGDMGAVIQEIRKNAGTAHIPILAFAESKNKELQTAATLAGANLVAVDDAVIPQLPHLLEQILMLE